MTPAELRAMVEAATPPPGFELDTDEREQAHARLIALAASLALALADAWSDIEAFCADCGPCNGGVTPPDDGSLCWNCGDLRATLAKLEELGT